MVAANGYLLTSSKACAASLLHLFESKTLQVKQQEKKISMADIDSELLQSTFRKLISLAAHTLTNFSASHGFMYRDVVGRLEPNLVPESSRGLEVENPLAIEPALFHTRSQIVSLFNDLNFTVSPTVMTSVDICQRVIDLFRPFAEMIVQMHAQFHARAVQEETYEDDEAGRTVLGSSENFHAILGCTLFRQIATHAKLIINFMEHYDLARSGDRQLSDIHEQLQRACNLHTLDFCQLFRKYMRRLTTVGIPGEDGAGAGPIALVTDADYRDFRIRVAATLVRSIPADAVPDRLVATVETTGQQTPSASANLDLPTLQNTVDGEKASLSILTPYLRPNDDNAGLDEEYEVQILKQMEEAEFEVSSEEGVPGEVVPGSEIVPGSEAVSGSEVVPGSEAAAPGSEAAAPEPEQESATIDLLNRRLLHFVDVIPTTMRISMRFYVHTQAAPDWAVRATLTEEHAKLVSTLKRKGVRSLRRRSTGLCMIALLRKWFAMLDEFNEDFESSVEPMAAAIALDLSNILILLGQYADELEAAYRAADGSEEDLIDLEDFGPAMNAMYKVNDLRYLVVYCLASGSDGALEDDDSF